MSTKQLGELLVVGDPRVPTVPWEGECPRPLPNVVLLCRQAAKM